MDKHTKELFEVKLTGTKGRILASSPIGISIELIEHLGEKEFGKIVKISESLVEHFGENARFNSNSINKYFNYPKTLPFIIRYQNNIEGIIVGVPLEHFINETWAHCDSNLQKGNTIYTYAYIVKKDYRHLGISKMLKRVYQNTLKKRGYKYVTGHVMEGISVNFIKDTQLIKKFKNWNNTGYTFEYYRCEL